MKIHSTDKPSGQSAHIECAKMAGRRPENYPYFIGPNIVKTNLLDVKQMRIANATIIHQKLENTVDVWQFEVGS
jgi:hypothetical protein